VRTAYLLFILLFTLTGCAKRGIVGTCDEGAYNAFIADYAVQFQVDSLSGNGSFEIQREGDSFSGNFSVHYSQTPKKWGLNLYGFFGMLLAQVIVMNDSFSVFSTLIEGPLKGAIDEFSIEEYTGIPLDAKSIQLLTTGRIPFDGSVFPSYCEKKNENLIEFSFEDNNSHAKIGWAPIDKRTRYYTIRRKKKKDLLKVTFTDFRDGNSHSLPYSITFTYSGREEVYFTMNYKYIEVK